MIHTEDKIVHMIWPPIPFDREWNGYKIYLACFISIGRLVPHWEFLKGHDLREKECEVWIIKPEEKLKALSVLTVQDWIDAIIVCEKMNIGLNIKAEKIKKP